jgi:hypothetical protein
MEERQLSTSLGRELSATHLLTHNCWNSMPEYFSRGSNETGVRSVVNGEVQDDFELIQHGWYDWRKAGEVIKRLLAKGRTPYQVAVVMGYIKDRGWVNRPPKARTL